MSAKRILDGRYALPSESRDGGMARVYKAADLEAESRIVAVKILKDKLEDRVLALAFEREMKSLLRLSHPNIVELLGAGKDPDTEERYLVLEWMEDDLEGALAEAPAWDEFLRRWGLPILRGLAHAHEAGVSHRDLKPANVLVDSEQNPRISDFGIAKIAATVDPGNTLQGWRSPPYTPREGEDGSEDYSRDVHAFGVLTLLILTGVDPEADQFESTYDSIEHCLGIVQCPEPLAELLARFVAEKRADRPRDGAAALAELKRLLDEIHEDERPPPPALYLSLHLNLRRYLEAEFDLATQGAQEDFILAELSDGVGVAPMDGKKFKDGTPTEGHYQIHAGTLRLHAALSRERDRLHLISAMAMRPSYLERERERSCAIDLQWRFGADDGDGEAGVRELERAIEEHAAAAPARLGGGSARGLIARWRRLLTALRTVETDRAVKQTYSKRRTEGRAVYFLCVGEVPVELIGPVVVESAESGFVRGEVILVEGKNALMRISTGDPHEIPHSGEVRTDTAGTSVAVRRQHAALDSIEEARSVRPDLKDLIVHPERARPPTPVEVGDWFQEKVDEDKRKIIEAALGSPDVMQIEGPPGTGKTTLITELILQQLRIDPNRRILLSAKTHAALDNVLERLADLKPDLRLIRAGKDDDPRVSEGASKFLVERQIKSWRGNVERRGRRFLARWAKEHGISERQVEIAARFEELAAILDSLKTLEAELVPLQAEHDQARKSGPGGTTTSVEVLDTLAEEIDQLRSRRRDLQGEREELIGRLVALKAGIIKTELQGAGAQDLRSRAMEIVPERTPEIDKCMQMIKVLGEWHARFGRGAGFSGAALSRAQVVASTCVGYEGIDGAGLIEFDLCIVDEASQATPPEVLIPMTRASSWVLVGDSKQLPPFVDEALRDPEVLAEHSLRPGDAEETLFSRWSQGLPGECTKELELQHRMVPQISALISECFYGGRLKGAPGATRPDIAKALAAPVLWYSTSAEENRFERRDGTSWINELESGVARSLLSLLDLAAESPLSVAVLTGYAPQVATVQRKLGGRNWKKLKVETSTVDAYQGRESDVVIYLVTRSNSEGKIGFLRERPRLNVALSRGRQALLIVGDQEFVESAHGENPFRPVLRHIREADPADCAILEAPGYE